MSSPFATDLTHALDALAPESEADAFACKLQLPAEAIKISVKPVGNIRLPVSASRARALIRHARQAPFGLGNETLFDTRIRNVWEIAKSRVQIDNRHWNNTLKPTLERIKGSLGLPEGKLVATLDKLLVYESGQFFVPHRDSERSDDMIATLIVVLPSDHKGGSLIVNHKGNDKRFTIRNPAADKLTLFSFYADCTHEVKPITEGYRIALSYNLSFTPAKPAVLPKQDTTELQHVLSAFFRGEVQSQTIQDRKPPEKLVYLLDHQYTQRSLSWSHMKGSDKVRGDALKAAATALDMRVSLCLVDISELWSAYQLNESNRDGFPPYFRGYSWYGEDWDDEELEDSDASDTEADSDDQYELQELIESGVCLTHWVTPDKTQYPELHVADSELCWTRASEEFTPHSQDYEGYMGNYGNTLDRQYRRAAIVLWPKTMHLHTLFRMDEAIGMRELLSLARVDPSAAKQEATAIFDTLWPDTATLDSSASLAATLNLLLLVNDQALSTRALSAYSIDAVSKARMRSLIELGTQHGKVFCNRLAAGWIDPPGRRYRSVSLNWVARLPHFCQEVKERGNTAWKHVLEKLWNYYFDKILEQHERDSRGAAPSERIADSSNQATQLVAMYRSAQCLPARNSTKKLLQHIRKKQHLYLDTTVVSFLESLSELEHDSAHVRELKILGERLDDNLSARLAKPARSADDWRMRVQLDCKCADCGVLGQFLKSHEQHCDLPLAKDRRMHLHRVIDGAELPVSHNTRREGRPYVLQLVKKRLLFKIEKQHRVQDAELLKQIRALVFN